MAQLTHVLCPIDFSATARTALAHAGALASWYEATLTVFHAYAPPISAAAAPTVGGTAPVLMPAPPEEMARQVREFCATVEGLPAARIETAVAPADPARQIVRQATVLHADLLVIGTHGRGGIERMFFGSVAEKVLRSADVPVLTVPPGAQRIAGPLFKTILCAVDFSEASLRALEYALLLARDADARLILLHVFEGAADDPRLLEASDITVADYLNARALEARARLEDAVPEQAREWSRPEVWVESGRSHKHILRVAEEAAAEVIVLGASGRGALDRWVFGSTADTVVRRATYPVLTLRASSD